MDRPQEFLSFISFLNMRTINIAWINQEGLEENRIEIKFEY